MIPDITDALIDGMIQTANMIRAGQSYWQQGRVTKLTIDPVAGEIGALVRGSSRYPYSVMIYLDSDNFGPATQCSCPVGDGCKHCAAVLFAARSKQVSGDVPATSKAVSLAKLQPPAQAAPLPQPLYLWLTEAQSQASALQTRRYEHVYVLTPRSLHLVKLPKGQAAPSTPPPEPQDIWVEVWLKQPSAKGKLAWHQPNHFDRSWISELPTAIDVWLAKQLMNYQGDVSGGTLKGVGGAHWLDMAIATGHLRWRNPDGAGAPCVQKEIRQPFTGSPWPMEINGSHCPESLPDRQSPPSLHRI